jgi:hypothetical protein
MEDNGCMGPRGPHTPSHQYYFLKYTFCGILWTICKIYILCYIVDHLTSIRLSVNGVAWWLIEIKWREWSLLTALYSWIFQWSTIQTNSVQYNAVQYKIQKRHWPVPGRRCCGGGRGWSRSLRGSGAPWSSAAVESTVLSQSALCIHLNSIQCHWVPSPIFLNPYYLSK